MIKSASATSRIHQITTCQARGELSFITIFKPLYRAQTTIFSSSFPCTKGSDIITQGKQNRMRPERKRDQLNLNSQTNSDGQRGASPVSTSGAEGGRPRSFQKPKLHQARSRLDFMEAFAIAYMLGFSRSHSSILANLPRTLGWLSARAFLQAYCKAKLQSVTYPAQKLLIFTLMENSGRGLVP